jgi:outer membrane protein TolC
MLLNRASIIVLFCLIIITNKALSQNPVKLSYLEYLGNVVENNPISKRAVNIQKYGEYQFKAAKGNYDPLISGGYENKFYGGSNYYSILNSEIKQPIFTSQFLKFGYDYGIGSNVNPELKTSTYGLPYLGVEVGLLQGLMIDSRRASYLKSKEYINYYSAESKIQLNSLLFESSQRYFDWLFALKQVSLTRYFFQLAQQRLTGVEALANIGEEAAVDTIEAAIFLQSRQLDFQSSSLENQKIMNDLASYNWQNNGIAEIQANYESVDSLETHYENARGILFKMLNQDSINNPVISKYNSFQNVLEIENRFRKEMIKPRLNINYNLLSNNPNAFNPILSTNNYKWGLNLSFPLLLRNSRNEYKMAKLNAQNNSFELANKSNELDFKMNMLKQTINLTLEQLQVAQKSVKYTKQLVEAEKLKFINGESSLFMVNTRESKWLETELKLAEYKLKFIKTVLNIIYLKGNLNYLF